MAKKKILEQPDEEMQSLQKAVMHDKADVVYLRKKKIKLRWIRGCVRDLMTDILLNESSESKVSAKCAAIIVLNGYWSTKLWYWLVWRWFYYVKQYTEEEYSPLMMMCKKKLGAENYFLLTTLMIGIKDTMMAMTRKETERILREQNQVQRGL